MRTLQALSDEKRGTEQLNPNGKKNLWGFPRLNLAALRGTTNAMRPKEENFQYIAIKPVLAQLL